MRYVESLIEEIMDFFEHEKRRCSEMLKNCPDGSLTCDMYKGRRRYRLTIPEGKDAEGKYRYRRKPITRDKELLRAFARREFASSAMCILEHNAKILNKAFSNLREYSTKAVIEGMRQVYQTLPEEMFEPVQQDAKAGQLLHEWALEKYEKSPYKVEGRIHTTSRGLKVRSRAELAIAEVLYRYGIPFRYEQVMWIKGHEFAPDFTFLGYDGREFYWEFCGMMTDPEYVGRFFRKREMYESAGITEWNDMIYSYSDGDSLDMRIIDAVIRTRILPRVYPDPEEMGVA